MWKLNCCLVYLQSAGKSAYTPPKVHVILIPETIITSFLLLCFSEDWGGLGKVNLNSLN